LSVESLITIAFNRPLGLIQPTIDQSPLELEEMTGSAFGEALVEPLSLRNPMKEQWLITPSEAVQIAVQRSKVLQDLGGAVLRSTNAIATIHEPAIQSTDPRLGVEAALSAFDAQLNSRMFASKNDYQINNRLLGGGTNLLQQDLVNFQNEITKTTAYGTDVYFRKNTAYDANNAPSNLFTSTWQSNLELGFRHPLARGGGLDYNRIAGPKSAPGNYSGILIARINEDTSIIDFEIALRDLISDVENAYWDLYFSYRNLEAKIAARDAALDTWRVEQLLREKMAESGEKETRAREQYHRFQAQVIEALTGREVDGTRTNNGSSGGTFRSVEGVHVAERRLRMLMNLPINDTKMLRPSHDPVLVNIMFDWHQSAMDALDLRPELRKQDLAITRSRLELIASKNALMPQFDLISQYRIRGLGNDLWGSSTVPFDNAVGTLASGAFQEWQFGLEMNMPVGLRRAYNNVRNAQLKLARDKDILLQKQRRVVHDLSNAYASVVRSYEVAQVSLEQRAAAHEQLAILRNLEQNNSRVNVNEILDAQSRASQADTALFEALVRYMISLKNIHYERGTLFEYNNIAFVDRVITRRASNMIGNQSPADTEPTLLETPNQIFTPENQPIEPQSSLEMPPDGNALLPPAQEMRPFEPPIP
ncbi:MAG: TolC family protein, partial [Pirellula sp.]|nr:TolC family protein [Pirellula sp.]